MIVLSIDTSCDDTSIAVVEKKKGEIRILSNIVSSQIEIHQEYGGVVPMLAQREHQKNLVPVLKKALSESKLLKKGNSFKNLKGKLQRETDLKENIIKFLEKVAKPKINAIAVTEGPGLEPCLWVGINFAKALSHAWDLPIIAVNHITGHIVSGIYNEKVKFPAIALIVSGGHTQLILVKKIGDYKIVGETRDDACGECFDKTARILGLSYPGGPIISSLAEKAKDSIIFPSPMIHAKNLDFSFSGLKTAVLYKNRERKLNVNEASKGIQTAILDVLIKKTKMAVEKYKTKSVIAGGGVTANKELRRRLKKEFDNVFLPSRGFSTDNAGMIGIASLFSLKYKKRITAKGNLRI